MRPLTEEETKSVFESESTSKPVEMRLMAELANYIGKNLVHLIDRDEDDAYCFRLHKDRCVQLQQCLESCRLDIECGLTLRVYYLPVAMLHLATSVARSNLISLGTCFGKFSKTGKFKLGITSLDWLAKYAKYKVGHDSVFILGN
jgi:60S ribosome subunit biogenesis protein NIP7